MFEMKVRITELKCDIFQSAKKRHYWQGILVNSAGNSIIKVEPFPYSDEQKIVPPNASVYIFTIDNPKPVDFSPAVGCALNRWYFLNNKLLSSSVKPGPWSDMAILTFVLWSETLISILVSLVENFKAFDKSIIRKTGWRS